MSNVDHALIKRSKAKLDFLEVPVNESHEKLVALQQTKRLTVRPIWDDQVDAIEGPLYVDYIRENPSYRDVYVREGVKAQLLRAVEALPPEYALVVRAGHRPPEVQLALLNMLKQDYMQSHPGVSEEDALGYARTYVSDPEIVMPPHCCGAAVDVDVIHAESGEVVDFGCSVNTDSPIAYLHSDLVTEKQYGNRMMLCQVMLEAGFAPYFTEWWHYSYGDQLWAKFYDKPHAIYSVATI